jgi:transposase-like protein
MTGRATTDATPQRVRATFLRELRKRGNVSDAARKARIDRTTAYRWRDAEPEFAAAWDEAIEHAIDVMESEAYRRAVEGVDEPVFGRIGKDQDGEVGTIRKYSDALMNTLLKAHRPE